MRLWFENQRVARTLSHCPQNFTVASEWAGPLGMASQRGRVLVGCYATLAIGNRECGSHRCILLGSGIAKKDFPFPAISTLQCEALQMN
jgi:hypothetical protein